MADLDACIQAMKDQGRSKEDILSALKVQMESLGMSDAKPADNDDNEEKPYVYASSKKDVGLTDRFGDSHKKRLDDLLNTKMENIEVIPNDKGLVVSEYPDTHPACTDLVALKAEWKLETQAKRNYVLIVEDMQNEYLEWIRYVEPNVKLLVDTFRELNLPIVWTNWNRRHPDGMYNAIDRFYGPRGVTGPDGKTNPCYLHGDGEARESLKSLSPQTKEEYSRSIVSYHLSKWADLDEDGREIMYPMCEAWGVNTIILVGAWTDDCIAATAFEALDRYGYDVVLIKNGVATATVNGGKMLECLLGACSAGYTAQEVCNYLKAHPEAIEPPKAPLVGSVRFTVPQQKR